MASTGDSVPFNPVPGYNKGTHQYGDVLGDEFHAPMIKELLASYARFTQRGVTLAGGQGVLKAGTVLAQKSDKKYYVYAVGGSGGVQTPLGFLREDRDTGGGNSNSSVSVDCLGNLVTSGIVRLDMLSGTDTASLASGTAGTNPVGGFGAATVTALNGRTDYPAGQFIF